MIFFRKLHKWLGLVIGAQLVIWLLSGTLISFIDQQTVSGAATRRQPAEEVPLASSGPFFPISRLHAGGISAIGNACEFLCWSGVSSRRE